MSSPESRPACIENVLRRSFAPEHLEVEDESHLHRGHPGAREGGGHFRVTLVSSRFEGAKRITRHRMVYDVLQDDLGSEIHALAIHAFTPGEWRARSS